MEDNKLTKIINKNTIVLASKSKSRKLLMKDITDDFITRVSNNEEHVPKNIKAKNIPKYLSGLKAADIAKFYPHNLVIGADTLVFVGEEIIGKPKNIDDARIIARLVSGGKHKIITGVTMIKENVVKSFSQNSFVHFINIPEETIEKYIHTSIPYDKAGGFAVEQIGEFNFVKSIEGNFENIMGLPVLEIKKYMKKYF